MPLSDREILQEVKSGNISVTPWDETRLSVNSYDVTLNEKLLYYSNPPLDPRIKNETRELLIPKTGLLMKKGTFYLGRINEYCENNSSSIVPMLDGKSSIARLGLFVHITAGFGDSGFKGTWTLELFACEDILIYPNMYIAQLFWERSGGSSKMYNGKYLGQIDATSSKSFKDIK